LKIALICTEKLPVPPVAGGAVQIYIDGIVPFLSQRHNITVFGIQYPGLPETETRNNVRYIRVPGNTGTVYLRSLKAALDSSFDLIHVFNRPKYALELMELFPDTRFSLSLHNEMFHPEKIADADAMKLIGRVEFINTVSKYIARTVTNRFPGAERKMHVVYSGVDAGYYKPPWSQEGLRYKNELKRKYGLQGYKVVLFVGRLSNKKGVDVLLKAMDKVMRANPKTALMVVGSKWYGKNEADDYTKSLQTISRNLNGPIHFTGFIPPAEIPIHYAMGDVFVCPSQWMEPLARVHYEAMAAGLPIITTDRGGNAEVVEGFGNGVVMKDASNADEMARHILYLLNHEAEAAKMGYAGRKLAEQNFNWKRVAGEVFQELEPGGGFGIEPGREYGIEPVGGFGVETGREYGIEPAGGFGVETGGIKDLPANDLHMLQAVKSNAAVIKAAAPDEKNADSIEVPVQAEKPVKPAGVYMNVPAQAEKPYSVAAVIHVPAAGPAASSSEVPTLGYETETAPAKIHSPVVKTEDIIIEIPEPDIKPAAAAAGYVASEGQAAEGYAASTGQAVEGIPAYSGKAAEAGSFAVPAAKYTGTAAKPPALPGKPYSTGWKFPAATAGRVAVVTLPLLPYTGNGSASAGAPAGVSRNGARPANGIVRFGNGKHLG
jgi:spore coat protein SA